MQVVLAYSLTFATFLLPAGQMADRVGPRITFIAGTFTLAWTNALSAFAPNMHGLIAGRALAGVGAAAVVSAENDNNISATTDSDDAHSPPLAFQSSPASLTKARLETQPWRFTSPVHLLELSWAWSSALC